MSRRVLVTGASGFVGKPVTRLLVEQGWEVVACSRKIPDWDPGVADWFRLDLLHTDAQLLIEAANAEVMIHLAWIATPGVYAESAVNLEWLRASTALSAAFLAAGGRHVVAAGSCIEYDCGQGRAAGPRSVYGAAKHTYRLVLRRQAADHGASVAWGRVFYLLGPEDHPDRFATSLARRLTRGEPAEISQGLAVRDFIDVRDCARYMVGLADVGAAGDFDLATGRGMRIRDVATALATAAGRPELVRVNPALDRPDEMPDLVGDPRPLAEATGLSPLYSLDDSIEHILEHFRSGNSSGAVSSSAPVSPQRARST